MSEIDFRHAYDALMERLPDPPPFEMIRAHMVEPREPAWVRSGLRAAVAGAVVVLLGIGGLAWLIGDGPQPAAVPTSVNMTAVEERLKNILQGLGSLCYQSSAQSDFDGDGITDAAVIGASRPATGCPTDTEPRDWIIAVAWSSGAAGSWPLPTCGVLQPNGSVVPTGICQVFASPDIDDDGRTELAVKVQQAAGSIALLHFYSLASGDAPPTPLEVGPGGPGPGKITPGQVFAVTLGSSPSHQANIRCGTASDGDPVLLITVAESLGAEWDVFEGTWRYEEDLMVFLAQRTYSVAKSAPEATDLIPEQSICGAPTNPNSSASGQQNPRHVVT